MVTIDDLVVDTYAAYLLYADSTPRYEPTDGLNEDMLAIVRMYAAEFEAYAADMEAE